MRRAVWLWFIGFVLLIGCRESAEIPTITTIQPLTVTAPTSVNAGEAFVVNVDAQSDLDQPITLTLLGSYGSRFVSADLQEGQASITVPADLTTQSGLTKVTVRGDGVSGGTKTIIVAGSAVEPLTPLVGARSIVADGESWAMAVVVPFDRFNNPLADGTPFTLRVRHPDQTINTLETETRHLLAWERIYSHTRAGRSTISVETEGVFGSAADLLEVPGWPVDFAVNAQFDHLEADGRQLVTLQTDVIVDRFGNAMPDGTQVTFVVEDVLGKRTLPAVTIDGSAETTLQAPDQPQELRISATIFNRSSQPFMLAFTESVAPFAVKATRVGDGVLSIEAGPVLGALNQYVADGTRVQIKVGERWVEAQVQAGYVRSELLAIGAADSVTVQIGAVMISAEIKDQP